MNTRTVIIFIGVALLASLLGIIVLATEGHSIPDVLQNLAVGSLTALGALLVPTSGTVARRPADQ